MANVIFDLDGTVIDSDHRKATLPCGSLDLAHWLENNVPAKIMQDKLLPLANVMRWMHSLEHNIVICTARIIQPADLTFIQKHRLKHDAILHRGHGDMRSDPVLKEELLTGYFKRKGYLSIAHAKPIMYEDNHAVIEHLKPLGVSCYDAARFNAILAKDG